MRHLLLCITALMLAPSAVRADSAKAYCELVRSNGEILKGDCIWSQRQGSANVDKFQGYAFSFPAAEDGRTYTRTNREGAGPSFKRSGYTLNVYWEKPSDDR
jgi:hypothetical protein